MNRHAFALLLAALWCQGVRPSPIDACTASPESPQHVLLVPYGTCPSLLEPAVAALAANSSYRFSWGEVRLFGAWFEARDHTVRAQTQQLVDSGQWEFVSGSWTPQDSTVSAFDDAANGLAIGHGFLQEHYRARPAVAWQVDQGGGFSSGLPQLLSEARLSGTVLEHSVLPDSSEPEFVWRPHRHADGVLAHSLAAAGSADQLDLAQAHITPQTVEQLSVLLRSMIEARSARLRTRHVLLPIKFSCEGSAHLAKQLEGLSLLMQHVNQLQPPQMNLQFGSFQLYFDRVRGCVEAATEWPELHGAIRPHQPTGLAHSNDFSGSQRLRQVVRMLRSAVRGAELWFTQLLELESLYKGDLSAPLAVLHGAREQLAELQSAGRIPAEAALALKQSTRELIERVHQVAASCLSKLLAPRRIHSPPELQLQPPEEPGVLAVLVTNPLGWLVNSTVSLVVPTGQLSITDAEGFAVASEIEYDSRAGQHRLRFHADAPPLGAAVFFVRSDHADRMLMAPRMDQHQHEPTGDDPELLLGNSQGLTLVLDDATGECLRLASPASDLSIKFSAEFGISASTSGGQPSKMVEQEVEVSTAQGAVSHAVTRAVRKPDGHEGLSIEHSLRVFTAAADHAQLGSAAELEFSISGLAEHQSVILTLRTDIDTGGFVLHDEGGLGLVHTPTAQSEYVAAHSVAILRGPKAELAVLTPHTMSVLSPEAGVLQIVLYQRRGDETSVEASAPFTSKLMLVLSTPRATQRLALSKMLQLPPSLLFGDHSKSRMDWSAKFETALDPLGHRAAQALADWEGLELEAVGQRLAPQVHISAVQVRDDGLDQMVLRLANLAEDEQDLVFTNLTWLFKHGFKLQSWEEQSLTLSSMGTPQEQDEQYEDCWLAGQQVRSFAGLFQSAFPLEHSPPGLHVEPPKPERTRAAKFKLLREVLAAVPGVAPKESSGSQEHAPESDHAASREL